MCNCVQFMSFLFYLSIDFFNFFCYNYTRKCLINQHITGNNGWLFLIKKQLYDRHVLRKSNVISMDTLYGRGEVDTPARISLI